MSQKASTAVSASFLSQTSERKPKGMMSQGPDYSPGGKKELKNTQGRLLGELTSKPSSFILADLSPKLSVCQLFLENTNIGYAPFLR